MELSKLLWRCRRGMLENDLILQSFLRMYGERLTDEEMSELIVLLDLPDQELCDLLMERIDDSGGEYPLVLPKLRKIKLK